MPPFKPVDPAQSFPELEQRVLARWRGRGGGRADAATARAHLGVRRWQAQLRASDTKRGRQRALRRDRRAHLGLRRYRRASSKRNALRRNGVARRDKGTGISGGGFRGAVAGCPLTGTTGVTAWRAGVQPFVSPCLPFASSQWPTVRVGSVFGSLAARLGRCAQHAIGVHLSYTRPSIESLSCIRRYVMP